MQRFGPWLKLAFSGLMVALVLWRSHPDRIWTSLAHAHWSWLLMAVALWILIQLLNVYKWWQLNRAQGIEVPFGRLNEVYYMGMFFNTFLPSGFGGDALRAYELAKLTKQGGTSTTSVIVDRFTSLYSLFLIATGALLIAPAPLRLIPVGWAFALDALGAFGLLCLLKPTWIRSISMLPPLARRDGARQFLGEIADASAALRSSAWVLASSLGVALVYQFLNIVMHQLLLMGLGLPVAFSYTACFLPILVFAASMPVSINGLGIREGGFVFFLGKVGVEPAAAVTIGLLSLMMLLLSGVWGAVLYAKAGRQTAAPLPL